MRRSSRLVVLAALAVSVSPVLLACGADKADPAQDASTAARSSTPSSTPEASSTPTETPTPTPTKSASGGLDAESKDFLARMQKGLGDAGTVHVAMTVGGGSVTSTANGDLVYGKDGNRMRLTMSMPQLGKGGVGVILLGQDTYLSMPGLTKSGQYFKVPAGSQTLSSLTGGATGLAPKESFAGFQAGLENAENLGHEKLGGVDSTHYKLTVNAAKAMQAMGVSDSGKLPETITYHVWLDGQDRVRRIAYSLGGGKLVLDMTKWGEPLVIKAPTKAHLVQAPTGF